MTRPVRHKAQCPHCGSGVDTMTPFSHWLRALPPPYTSSNFDNENLDYIWFHYRQGWFITIEEKRFGGRCPRAQQDTHGIVAQMLAIASKNSVSTLRGTRPIEYRGHYVIVFEKTTPDDSQWVLVNGKKTQLHTLMNLLATGRIETHEQGELGILHP